MNKLVLMTTTISTTIILLILSITLPITGSAFAQQPSAQGAPTLTILSPTEGKVIIGDTAIITFVTTNWNWTTPVGQPNQPNTGHMHFFVDGQMGLWASGNALIIPELKPGNHQVLLSLQNNDHKELSPPVSAKVNFSITLAPSTDKPALTILSPTDGAAVNGSSVNIAFVVTNWDFQMPVGQGKAVNTGHIHAFIDGGNMVVWASSNSITYTGLAPGRHTVTLSLQNNDHSELSPPVSKSVSFEVKSGATTTTTGQATAAVDLGPVITYSLAALAVSIIVLIIVLYLAVRGRPR